MSDKSLQLSEQALRLAMALMALGLAAYLAAKPNAGLNRIAGPKPVVVMEW